jgi:phenylalanyl-tRNA synthetase beta chain
LTDTFGKKRKEAAIGVYDFDKIKWPITYTTFKPESLSFQPLGTSEMLNLKQILEKHEKGKEFGHLLKAYKEYPVFIDADKQVLSMPPIINSEYSGKVTKDTKNVFIEVSGFDFEKVSFILNIIASALAERKGTIYSVNLQGLNKTTPEFKSRIKKIKIQDINSLLGIKLTAREINELLYKQRFYSKQDPKDKDLLIVEIPFFRKDIIHENDLIEEIAISYGYNNLEPIEPKIYTQGSILEETQTNNDLSEKLIGLEFQEILSFMLTNEKEQFDNMALNESKEIIKIKNPLSETFTCLRHSLLPSSLKFLSNNIDKDFPQKIFEIGKIVVTDQKKENKSREENRLCLTISHSKANFTEIQEILNYLIKEKVQLKPKDLPSFISGRCAEIIINKKSIGIIGEIHPKVLSKWKLRMPAVSLEINLDDLN